MSKQDRAFPPDPEYAQFLQFFQQRMILVLDLSEDLIRPDLLHKEVYPLFRYAFDNDEKIDKGMLDKAAEPRGDVGASLSDVQKTIPGIERAFNLALEDLRVLQWNLKKEESEQPPDDQAGPESVKAVAKRKICRVAPALYGLPCKDVTLTLVSKEVMRVRAGGVVKDYSYEKCGLRTVGIKLEPPTTGFGRSSVCSPKTMR